MVELNDNITSVLEEHLSPQQLTTLTDLRNVDAIAQLYENNENTAKFKILTDLEKSEAKNTITINTKTKTQKEGSYYWIQYSNSNATQIEQVKHDSVLTKIINLYYKYKTEIETENTPKLSLFSDQKLTTDTPPIEKLHSTAHENPEEAPEIAHTLVNIIANNPETREEASATLRSLARHHPQTLSTVTEDISTLIYHAENPTVRHRLTATISDLIDHLPNARTDFERGLTESTRIRADRFWQQNFSKEKRTIWAALHGWNKLAKHGHTIPPEPVENAVHLTDTAEQPLLETIIKLLTNGIKTNSNRGELAATTLITLLHTPEINLNDKIIESFTTVIHNDTTPHHVIEEPIISNGYTNITDFLITNTGNDPPEHVTNALDALDVNTPTSATPDQSPYEYAKQAHNHPQTIPVILPKLTNKIYHSPEDAVDAAHALHNIAKTYPEETAEHGESISQAINHTTDGETRKQLAKTLTLLVELTAPITETAKSGLTDATRIRPDYFWENDPNRELTIINTGLTGWNILGSNGHTIPAEVVINAASIRPENRADNQHTSIEVFKHALHTESPKAKLALEELLDITLNETNQNLRTHALRSIAIAVIEHPDNLSTLTTTPVLEQYEYNSLKDLLEKQTPTTDDSITTALNHLNS